MPVVGDSTATVEFNGAALLEQLPEIAAGALDTGFHPRDGQPEVGGGALMGVAVDIDSREGVAGRGCQLVEQRSTAGSVRARGWRRWARA